MPAQLPYMVAPGLIPKILTKIEEAKRPDRFTQDFLGTKLGHASGSAKPIIPLLKRMGFLNSDGSPTAIYDQFRNSDTQGAAVAQGIRNAYAELFERNKYAGDLPKDKLKSLIMEVTGGAHDDRTVEATLSTFTKLKELADFDADPKSANQSEGKLVPAATGDGARLIPEAQQRVAAEVESVGLNLAYTINIVLPETTNPEVFNSIFKSLKDNLLKKS
jgi:Family of unknown function (DUF5343)